MLHKDPFDRISIAQAVAEGLDFVTNDEPISEYPAQTIWQLGYCEVGEGLSRACRR